ncbi:TPA: hypothetical protein KON86_004137 [Clostridioides difficile]|uniref:hypothetical protein n=1 Tax=Clostridioides difficile TaxID=1496 RepID=UPI000BB1DA2D|nr:hypothetical protein [Clostridioides difficile]AXU76106.1 hypothetical protein CDIF28670_02537 [Clostridioides difficile]MDB0498829.1 hypothetical protein [Clostridioides difficile]MDS6285709.1 hypothetical protein [Clostridioides difficile]MDU8771466.1 hypothetical protein [Clostridioides difficile]PBH27197.1 hypothetical protein BGV23_18910 [Clostridioides difficile]
MVCAYCGQEAKGTREHIISCAILDLFPECFITIDTIRDKVYLGDPVVKDVCAECNNNKISYIDSYAKDVISNYFIQKYEKDDMLDFVYNYTLVQKMLLKYAFNDLRSHKDDTSFFNSNILDFLMNKDIVEPLRNVTILAGLAINTSPIPDFIFGNNKIRWGKDPAFFSNSIIEHLDYNTGEISLRNENPHQEFKKMSFSYVFRFNSVQFLLICWDDNISDEDLEENNVILQYQYPYTILSSEGHHTLSRCTSEVTYQHEMLIDVILGQGIFDEVTFMRGTYSYKNQQYLKEIEIEWQKEEKDLARRFSR